MIFFLSFVLTTSNGLAQIFDPNTKSIAHITSGKSERTIPISDFYHTIIDEGFLINFGDYSNSVIIFSGIRKAGLGNYPKGYGNIIDNSFGTIRLTCAKGLQPNTYRLSSYSENRIGINKKVTFFFDSLGKVESKKIDAYRGNKQPIPRSTVFKGDNMVNPKRVLGIELINDSLISYKEISSTMQTDSILIKDGFQIYYCKNKIIKIKQILRGKASGIVLEFNSLSGCLTGYGKFIDGMTTNLMNKYDSEMQIITPKIYR